MMRAAWPRHVMRELLARAKANGEARVELPSARAAELMRYSIYKFRKRYKLGDDVMLSLRDNVIVAIYDPLPVLEIEDPIVINPGLR